MKKVTDLSQGRFLKLLFAFLALAFLVAAPCMPDRNRMLTGLWRIMSQPGKISANFFAIGGYSATFLNMGLLGLCCLLLFVVFRGTPDSASTLAVLLTVGFSAWGITLLNIWPTVMGVLLYCLVKGERPGNMVNAMLFSTGIAPLITELMLRYLTPESVGFSWQGILLAVGVGLFIGFFLPAGMAFAPKVHKGFDLYSAALPVGLTAWLLHCMLYKAPGVALPQALSDAVPASVAVAAQTQINVFCGVVFGLCAVLGLALGCRPKDYWQLLKKGTAATCTNPVLLVNLGLYGLFILGYYNLVGATFNAVTFGLIFCMVCTCHSGANPGNVWPIMAGYVLASLVFGWLSPLLGGNFALGINAQTICTGLCFASGMSPIRDKYGWPWAMVAAMLHYLLVSAVPLLHGGFCLYNGGFTAALVCLILIPQLEHFLRREESTV